MAFRVCSAHSPGSSPWRIPMGSEEVVTGCWFRCLRVRECATTIFSFLLRDLEWLLFFAICFGLLHFTLLCFRESYLRMAANQGYEKAWSSVSGWIGQWGCGGMSLESVGSLTWKGRCCLKFCKDCQNSPESSCWCISCLWLRKCGWEVMNRWEVDNRTIDQKSNPWHFVSILGCISLLLCLVGNCFFFLKTSPGFLPLGPSALGSGFPRLPDGFYRGWTPLAVTVQKKAWMLCLPSVVYGFTIGWLRSKHTLARWLGCPLRAGPGPPKLPLCPILSLTIENVKY